MVIKNKFSYYTLKRIFDIILSSISIVITSLPAILIVVAIKLTSKGPVFFISKRIGESNKTFTMYKFRTMVEGTPLIPYDYFKDREGYYTKAGRLLRRLSLDELPQLFNIIKGDMSFVGPRPVLESDMDLIELRNKKNIHFLKPGLTGLAQIKGKNKLSAYSKAKFDKLYSEKYSFMLDIKIIFMTNFFLIKNLINEK